MSDDEQDEKKKKEIDEERREWLKKAGLGAGAAVAGAGLASLAQNPVQAYDNAQPTVYGKDIQNVQSLGTSSNPLKSVNTEQISTESIPSSYYCYTNGSTIYGIPQDNPIDSSMSKVTKADIGDFLGEVIKNQLPPQGDATEGAGKLLFKRGVYPGTLTNVVLPTQTWIEGEIGSHFQESKGAGTSIPQEEPPVVFEASGNAFIPPDTGGGLSTYQVLKNIQLEGDGSGIGIYGDTNNGFFDWMRVENCIIQNFDHAFEFNTTNKDLPIVFKWVQIRLNNGSSQAIAGVNNRFEHCTINNPIQLNDSVMTDCILHQNGEGVNSGMIEGNGASVIKGCRFRKTGGTDGEGGCVTLKDNSRAVNCSVWDSGDFYVPFSIGGAADRAKVRDCVDETADSSYSVNVEGTDCLVADCDFPHKVFENGTRNRIVGEFEGTIDIRGTKPIFNGRYYIIPTIDMGGSDGVISPVDTQLDIFDLKIDAGGAAVNLQGIDTIATEGVKTILYHTGGENITLVDDAAVSDSLKNSGDVDVTLDANGELIAYVYDGQNSVWREMWRNTQ